jgi:hypothetical protein
MCVRVCALRDACPRAGRGHRGLVRCAVVWPAVLVGCFSRTPPPPHPPPPPRQNTRERVAHVCSSAADSTPPRSLFPLLCSTSFVRAWRCLVGPCVWPTTRGCPCVHVMTSAQDAFIFNFHSHWFAVRKLCGVWFNLDSTKKKPQVVLAWLTCPSPPPPGSAPL